jgi:hypothetical protein
MNFTLECDELRICPTTEDFTNILSLQFGDKTKCCENPVLTSYYRNLSNVTIQTVWETLDYQPGANQCEGYFGLIRRRRLYHPSISTASLLAQVNTMTSTTVYKNGSTIISTDMNSYLPDCLTVLTPDPNTVSEQIYEEPGWDSIEITTVVTFLSGQVMTHFYKILPIGQNCTFEGTQLGVNYLIQNETYTYTNPPQNLFTLDSGCIVITKSFATGFHTINVVVDNIAVEYCIFLDCDDFNCKVVTNISDNILKYTSTKNKDYLDKALDISLKYDLLINPVYNECLDCCEKCEIFDALNLQLTECSSC